MLHCGFGEESTGHKCTNAISPLAFTLRVSVFVSKEEGKEGVAVSDDCAMCIDQIHRVGMFSIGTSCIKSWIRNPG